MFDSTYSFADVPQHFNVEKINYPEEINTVWDMIEKYSRLVNQSPSVTYYGGRDETTHRVWFGYKIIDTVYSNIAKQIKQENPAWTSIQVYDSTNKKMIERIKNEWKPPNSNMPKGTINNIAQTRVASSYGLTQFLYSTARDKGYPKEDVPENINLINYLEMFYKTQKKYLQDGLSISVESGNNWPTGYEHSFSRKIYVPKWNSRTTYAKDVINNSKKFLPK